MEILGLDAVSGGLVASQIGWLKELLGEFRKFYPMNPRSVDANLNIKGYVQLNMYVDYIARFDSQWQDITDCLISELGVLSGDNEDIKEFFDHAIELVRSYRQEVLSRGPVTSEPSRQDK